MGEGVVVSLDVVSVSNYMTVCTQYTHLYLIKYVCQTFTVVNRLVS